MSERPLATASVGTCRERRFGELAEMLEYLVADAASGSEGTDKNTEALDCAGEG
jgi:hypothetical protein